MKLYYRYLIITGIKKHDSEGRVITAEFEKFFLVTSCKQFSILIVYEMVSEFM